MFYDKVGNDFIVGFYKRFLLYSKKRRNKRFIKGGRRRVNDRVENWFHECKSGALTIRTPGVQVRLEYPRQFYAQIENFRTNKKYLAYYICSHNRI